MPSPFPGMDPFLEKTPIFHELHTQMLAEAQALLQPQVRPKYVVCLENRLSEGSVWDAAGMVSLERKEPDITVVRSTRTQSLIPLVGYLARPTASVIEDLDEDELELRKQRRIVIYLQAKPRLAVTTIELLSPSNKEPGSIGQQRYMEKRASALHGGLHWVEIDLLRGGQRPEVPVPLKRPTDYMTYVAQATATGWNHLVYGWNVRDRLPALAIPLLGDDRAVLDLGACFGAAYDRIAADAKADYNAAPPLPPVRARDRGWINNLLREQSLRH